jgi:hypothetical protein
MAASAWKSKLLFNPPTEATREMESTLSTLPVPEAGFTGYNLIADAAD